MKKRKFLQCATQVKPNAVSRVQIDGVEHIVVSSSTLPDNIVMNGIMYPADAIQDSFSSLDRTFAPVEHPTDGDGNFISAADPIAIHNFHAGAFNTNVRYEDGRVHIDKVINVQEALKTDRGKRLLDRINEIETNETPRPIHTSVGVFLAVEELDAPKTNSAGQEYSMVASDMVFDHDAILLDSVGAAQPHQGVGVAVNYDGAEVEVDKFLLANEEVTTNEGGLTHNELRNQLETEIIAITAAEWTMVVDIVDEETMVIFETHQGFFQVPYRVDSGTAKIVGLPLRVDREVAYTPKVNSNNEGDAMKDIIVNALKAKSIETEGLSDDELMVKYNEMLQANQSSDDDASATDDQSQLAEIVASAVAPIMAKIGELEGVVNATAASEKDELAKLIANSGKYPGLDADSAKLLSVDKLKEMAANCGTSYGLPLSTNSDGAENQFNAPTEMPK